MVEELALFGIDRDVEVLHAFGRGDFTEAFSGEATEEHLRNQQEVFWNVGFGRDVLLVEHVLDGGIAQAVYSVRFPSPVRNPYPRHFARASPNARSQGSH